MSFTNMRKTKRSSIFSFSLFVAASVTSCRPRESRLSEEPRQTPWASWIEMDRWSALYQMTKERDVLFRENLIDMQGPLPKVDCGERWKTARSFDGSCNDLSSPGMGMKGIAFGRNIPVEVIKNSYKKYSLQTPDPALVAERLLRRREMIPARHLNVFAAAWIQFMTRDWFIRTPDLSGKSLVSMNTSREESGASTQLPGTLFSAEKQGIPTTVNETTHWWDLSQIYGTSEKDSFYYRSGVKGMMKLDNGIMPEDKRLASMGLVQESSPHPFGGWWIGMSMMYHLFLREHNLIAGKLAELNPDWSDDQLFDKARLITTAVMAKIHTVDWTPAILDNPTMHTGMNINWNGVNPADYNELRNHSQWGPVIASGNDLYKSGMLSLKKPNHFGVPFTLTEEFTAVYRFHSLTPESIDIFSADSGLRKGSVETASTVQGGSLKLIRDIGIDSVALSFLKSNPGAIAPRNYPNFLRNIKMNSLIPKAMLTRIPSLANVNAPIDMAAVDILRDRERGIPRYNDFRKAIHLKPVEKWEDFVNLSSSPEEQKWQREFVEEMREVYNDDINAVDAMVGSLAEFNKPQGWAFGETQFQIFLAMASRRIISDRFFNENFNEATYTQLGLDHIKSRDFSNLLVAHFPTLAKYKPQNVKSGFSAW